MKIVCKIYLKSGRVINEKLKFPSKQAKDVLKIINYIHDSIDQTEGKFMVGHTSVMCAEVAAVTFK